MKDGIYRAADGQLVYLTATATGWLIRRADGTTTEIRR